MLGDSRHSSESFEPLPSLEDQQRYAEYEREQERMLDRARKEGWTDEQWMAYMINDEVPGDPETAPFPEEHDPDLADKERALLAAYDRQSLDEESLYDDALTDEEIQDQAEEYQPWFEGEVLNGITC